MPTSWEKDSGKENARELAQASTRRSSDRSGRRTLKPASTFRVFVPERSTRQPGFPTGTVRSCFLVLCNHVIPLSLFLSLSLSHHPRFTPDFSSDSTSLSNPLLARPAISTPRISRAIPPLMIHALLSAAVTVLVRTRTTVDSGGPGGTHPRAARPRTERPSVLCASVRG